MTEQDRPILAEDDFHHPGSPDPNAESTQLDAPAHEIDGRRHPGNPSGPDLEPDDAEDTHNPGSPNQQINP